MHLRSAIHLALFVLVVLAAGQQTSARAQQPPGASGAMVKGTIVDPDSALIPGATVTLTPASGKAMIVQSRSDGTYAFQAVPAGTYSETVTMQGFSSFVKQGLRIAPGQSLTIDARMSIQEQSQQVNVTANSATVSTDPESNASSTVIKGKDLDALSDDPDDLSSELSALAGPSAGPNGGQIYVDGFTGGQLPPKSSIREIRVNQNPFSAQYDRVGYGRVEVFTKPGTDKFHGSFQGQGNANFFNTSNPFLGSLPPEPYHTIFVFGNITGPISPKASFTIGGSHRVIQDNTIFFGTLLATGPNATIPCPPGTLAAPSSCGVFSSAIPTLYPQVRTDFSPRVDYQLTEKNTLTMRYQYETNSQHNGGIGQLDLPSTGYNLESTENEIQMTDSQIVNTRMINETHFEYSRDHSTQTPLSTGPTLTVQGSFTSGGSSTQEVIDHQDHFEVQNYTSLALAKHFIRFGGRLRTTRDANYSNSQSKGIFTYSCLMAKDCSQSYQTGQASQYVAAQISQASVQATLADLGLYVEDDWKARPNLTVSYGLRFETQNHIHDHHDFAPRVSVAYGLGRGTTPKTVLRGGFGIFYDRFNLTNVITTEQENGINQQLFKISNPGADCSPSNQTAAACGTGSGGTQTTYTLAPNLRSPYLMQFAFGADQQIGKYGTISVNYLNMRGVHEFNSQNLTAPVPQPDGTVIGNPDGTPNLYQFASHGVFRQNQLSISPRISYGRSVSLWGFYSLNFAKADSSGSGYFSSVANNLHADYGRASFDQRNRLFLGGSFTFPYRFTLSPFIAASSGQPFNIITGTDLNHDSILNNDRPAYADCSSTSQTVTHAAIHGCFERNPAPGTPRVPINAGTGPANFTMNLRLVKTFGFGRDTSSRNAATAQQGSQGPPPGLPGGGRGGTRGGGGPFGGSPNSGRRYSVNVGVLANNIFNFVDFGTPSGVVGSPQFYTPVSLAGRPYTSNTAVRTITLTASFTF